MIELNEVNPVWINLIKILSPMVMIGAIAIDLTMAYRWNQHLEIPKLLKALGALGTVALTVHLFESIIASAMARKQGLNPLRFGLYTFLVGTVAFVDLLEDAES
ncbi:MAG: hypothetical protein HC810_02280 [Acaryochloridaceae cyanobacterium RL_2_7]|nr:hypothetical protein [Acaryochloridaceae cyanobacterium RL_2_7]